MSVLSLPEVHKRLERVAGALVDLDGTLISGSRLLPGAMAFLSNPPCPFVIVSNDSEHTPQQLSQRFRSHGVSVSPSSFVLAGTTAIERLAVAAKSPTMVLGVPGMRRWARRLGIPLSDDQPARVLIMRDRSLTFARLAAAARAIHSGARVTLACPDLSHPGPRGEPVPEAGTLAVALESCTGGFAAEVVGKPEMILFEEGARRLGLPMSDCVMIGDNPLTDGVGAARSGMKFFQVCPPTAAADFKETVEVTA